MRRRRCHHATEGSRGCPGSWKDVEICNTEPSKQCNFVADGMKSKNSKFLLFVTYSKFFSIDYGKWEVDRR